MPESSAPLMLMSQARACCKKRSPRVSTPQRVTAKSACLRGSLRRSIRRRIPISVFFTVTPRPGGVKITISAFPARMRHKSSVMEISESGNEGKQEKFVQKIKCSSSMQRKCVQHRLLPGNQLLHALTSECHHLRQLCVVKDLVLRRGLEFDHLSSRRHYKIHIHIGAGVFFVAEIQQHLSIYNS